MYVQFYQCNGIEPCVISLTKLPQFFFIQQRNFFTLEKSLIPTCNNMAAISFFLVTNMAAVTSCENDLKRSKKGNVPLGCQFHR